jgi:hypothetical protein
VEELQELRKVYPCVPVCVCVCVCVCVRNYLYQCLCLRLSIYQSINLSISSNMHTCMYVCMHVFMHTCMNAYIMYIYIHIKIFMYIYIHIKIYQRIPITCIHVKSTHVHQSPPFLNLPVVTLFELGFVSNHDSARMRVLRR